MTTAAVFTPYSIIICSAASNLPSVGDRRRRRRYQRQEQTARSRREFLRPRRPQGDSSRPGWR